MENRYFGGFYYMHKLQLTMLPGEYWYGGHLSLIHISEPTRP